METSMAQAQTLKARVALPPVRQEEDEGSPHFSALDATTVDADDEELPFNIAALALKRELFARYRAYMERETLGHERIFTSPRRTLGAPV
jgi:hypothetical protein